MLLNAKQACGYLKDIDDKPMKAEHFRNLVNTGKIGFLMVGNSKRYPKEELDRWQRELTYIDCTKEVKRGGRTSRYLPKQGIKGIDALASQRIKNKLNYFVNPNSLQPQTTQEIN